VYSANIEGNSVDLNSYMNSEVANEAFKPVKEVEEISDLIKAYRFAIEHPLNEQNLLEAHQLLSNTILIKGKRGNYRTDRMGIYDNSGLVYLAVEPEKVDTETSLFFTDLKELLSEQLTTTEIFYHASLIHLKFAQIHPFWDGNGRSARLLEKWFLAEKLGEEAWKIESEHCYKKNIAAYYQNINLGMDYYSIDYSQCLPFLMMLVSALPDLSDTQ
jgi:Fic family protein